MTLGRFRGRDESGVDVVFDVIGGVRLGEYGVTGEGGIGRYVEQLAPSSALKLHIELHNDSFNLEQNIYGRAVHVDDKKLALVRGLGRGKSECTVAGTSRRASTRRRSSRASRSSNDRVG